jgi:large subunit ribosomal protein L33
MAKKSARIRVGLKCSETGIINYVTVINKMNTKEMKLMKYCPILMKHTLHEMTKKLD